MFLCRGEGSSKVQSRIEHQQQLMRNANKFPNNVKCSPPKEKLSPISPPKEMSPASPMDDIERGTFVTAIQFILFQES